MKKEGFGHTLGHSGDQSGNVWNSNLGQWVHFFFFFNGKQLVDDSLTLIGQSSKREGRKVRTEQLCKAADLGKWPTTKKDKLLVRVPCISLLIAFRGGGPLHIL